MFGEGTWIAGKRASLEYLPCSALQASGFMAKPLRVHTSTGSVTNCNVVWLLSLSKYRSIPARRIIFFLTLPFRGGITFTSDNNSDGGFKNHTFNGHFEL